MEQVTLDRQTYDVLMSALDRLKREKEQLIKEHKEEIDKLVKEGKVRVIETNLFNIFDPHVEYKNFDDVKSEVEEHFKQGLFKEELEKYKKLQFDSIIKREAEKDTLIDDLKRELEAMRNRNLLQRIFNY